MKEAEDVGFFYFLDEWKRRAFRLARFQIQI